MVINDQMSLEKFLNEPVSEIGFSHNYTKLYLNRGTTIRMGIKDTKKYTRKVGDIVWLYHSNLRFKARITKIERKAIKDIPLEILKKDCHPYLCESHENFAKGMSQFYSFQFDKLKIVYIIYWERLD